MIVSTPVHYYLVNTLGINTHLCVDSHTIHTFFLLIFMIEIPAIKPTIIPNVEIATTVLNINSTGTKGCVSQVPGRVYTDGLEPKIILLNLFYMYIIATEI